MPTPTTAQNEPSLTASYTYRLAELVLLILITPPLPAETYSEKGPSGAMKVQNKK